MLSSGDNGVVKLQSTWKSPFYKHLNFFRIHLLYFIFLPLIVSGFFHAADGGPGDGNQDGTGKRGTSYIDSLFLCYSAMTATGLTPINLSTLRPVQQVFLFILMLIGDITVVSLVMVLVRKRYFRKHCQELLEANHVRRTNTQVVPPDNEKNPHANVANVLEDSQSGNVRQRVCESPEVEMRCDSPPAMPLPQAQHAGMQTSFAEAERFRHREGLRARTRGKSTTVPSSIASSTSQPIITEHPPPADDIPLPHHRKNTGHGGFPSPFSLFVALAPSTTAALHTRLAQPVRRHTVLASPGAKAAGSLGSDLFKVARWLPEGISGLVIGRNSRFWVHELTDEELEVIGGVEYRALRVLSYLVAAYFALSQLIPLAIIAPYVTLNKRWQPVFQEQGSSQIGSVDPTWASLYAIAAAYTGCGMSLVDLGMLPFNQNYLMIFVLIIPILAGNHALPIFLRLCVWLGTKIVRDGSEMDETLHFLLDHPRRCFLYLFPSHQTWYLLAVLLGFTAIEMAGFFLLNLGLPVVENLGPWQKFADGLFQSLSVRASGFGILPVAQFAPALLFLYVGLMYVAIYPISMSIRGTNVYEERALGIYNEPETTDEPNFQGQRHEIFSKYFMWHVRKQLAFDIWPLALGIFLICILERKNLMDDAEAPWYNIFRIVFELVSAYATIGLSLGLPTQNYSFCGAFSTTSKLVVICVMLRGRHRGLPVAIDRAILLPREYSRLSENPRS